jgi:hypothetical protein
MLGQVKKFYQDGATSVCDFSEPFVIEVSRVARHAGDDQLGPEQLRGLFQLVVVDQASGGVHLKKNNFQLLTF